MLRYFSFGYLADGVSILALGQISHYKTLPVVERCFRAPMHSKLTWIEQHYYWRTCRYLFSNGPNVTHMSSHVANRAFLEPWTCPRISLMFFGELFGWKRSSPMTFIPPEKVRQKKSNFGLNNGVPDFGHTFLIESSCSAWAEMRRLSKFVLAAQSNLWQAIFSHLHIFLHWAKNGKSVDSWLTDTHQFLTKMYGFQVHEAESTSRVVSVNPLYQAKQARRGTLIWDAPETGLYQDLHIEFMPWQFLTLDAS